MVGLQKMIIMTLAASISGKIPCDPESFKFINAPNPIRPDQTYVFQVGNREEVGCAIDASYVWELYKVYFDRLMSIDVEGVLQIVGLTKSRINRINFSPISRYKPMFGDSFALRVTLIPSTMHYPSYRIHIINISLETYTFGIVGGRHRIHSLGSGSLKFMINSTRETNKPVKFTDVSWMCVPSFKHVGSSKEVTWTILELFLRPNMRHECDVVATVPDGRILRDHQTLDVKQTPDTPILEIICLQNCLNASAFNLTVLQYICHANCFGSASWSVQPFDQVLQDKLNISGKNNDFVEIPAGALQHGVTYNVLAVLGEVIATYTISFILPSMNISVFCIENCYKRHREITFGVTCEGECYGLDYNWEILPLPYIWDWTTLKLKNDIIGNYSFPRYTFPPETGATVYVRLLRATANTSFIVDKYKPSITSQCISEGQLCVRPSPGFPVVITAVCTMDCDVPGYEWRLDPPYWLDPDHVIRNSIGTTLILPPNSYRAGQTLKATLYADELNPVDNLTVYFADPPFLEILCVKNCNSTGANPYRPTILEVDCTGACANAEYDWSVLPLPTKRDDTVLDVIENTTKLFLPSNSYQPNDEVNVTVMGAGSSADYRLLYVTPDTNVTIYCINNCLDPASPASDIILLAVCTSFCDEIYFVWTLEPVVSPFLWYDKVELSYRNRTITIKQKLLFESRKLNVTVYAKPGNAMASYEFGIHKPTPNLQLRCIENCEEFWTYAQATFEVECLENCIELEYSWRLWDGIDQVNKSSCCHIFADRIAILPFSFESGKRIRLEVTVRESSAYFDIPFKEQEPILELECYPKPCFTVQNRLEKVIVNVTCKTGCIPGQRYWWNLDPKPSSEVWTKQIIKGIRNNSLTFLPSTFKHEHNLTLTVSTRGSGFTSAFVLFWNPIPEFRIVCLQNCHLSNPYEPVQLKAICEWSCNYIESYLWTFALPENVTEKEFNRKLKLSPRQTHVTVPRNTYRDGDIVEVRAQGASAVETIKLSFVEPVPVLEIVCRRNCHYNPSKDIVLEVNCLQFCVVPYSYQWSIEPDSNLITYHNKNRAIYIPLRTFHHRDFVGFKACKGKGCALLEVLLIVPPSDFEIHCIRNCINSVSNPKETVILEAICKTNCDDQESAYYWNIMPGPVSEREDWLSTEQNSERLIIKAETYYTGLCVEIHLTRSDHHIKEPLCFVQPVPVLGILCQQNCGYPDPTYSLIVNITCFKHCHGLRYKWNISPQPRDFRWVTNIRLSRDNVTLTVKAKTFEEKERALFIVTTSGFKTERIFKFSRSPPELGILCGNCDNVKPHSPALLTAICYAQCDNIKYTWDIDPKPAGFIWSLNISLSSLNNTMIILPDTYEDGSVVSVYLFSNKSARAIMKVKYQLIVPVLSLICKINCNYVPYKKVCFILSCKGDCELFQAQAICSAHRGQFKVPITIKTWNATSILIEISEFESKFVDLRCTFDNNEVNVTVNYAAEFWSGDCAIKPVLGISGVTEHTIECANFVNNATYIIYVFNAKISRHFTVLILHSQDKLMQNIYLPPYESGIVLIQVGWVWKLYVSISLTVSIQSPFINMPYEDILEILRNRYRAMYNHLQNNKVQSALQIAVATEESTESLRKDDRRLYKMIVLLLFAPYSNQFEPVQLLSFVLLQLKGEISIFGVRISMRLADEGCNRIMFLNETFIYYREHIIEDVGHKLISIVINGWQLAVRNALNRGTEEMDGNLNFRFGSRGMERELIAMNILAQVFQDPDMPEYGDPKDYMDFGRTMRATVRHILAVIDFIIYFLGKINRLRTLVSEDVTIQLSKFATDRKQGISFNISNSEVYVVPIMFREALTINMGVAHIFIYPYWLDHKFEIASADVLYVSITKITGTKKKLDAAKGAYRANIFLNDGKNMSSVVFTPFPNKLIVFQVNVPVNQTLQIDVMAENGQLAITRYRPRKWMRQIDKFAMDGLSMTIFYTAKTYPTYVSFRGDSQVIFNFTSLSCLSWNGWQHRWLADQCLVAQVFANNNVVPCDCTSSALLTANSIKPTYKILELKNPFKETKILHRYIEYLTVIAVAILFIFTLFGMLSTMRNAAFKKWIYLEDNVSTDVDDIYVVCVRTGIFTGSGTTSRVSIQMAGTKDDSLVHVLNVHTTNVLKRNDLNSFLIFSPRYLGDIKVLRIWCDYKGKKPDWFCDSVVITHLPTGKRYVFVISRWFSLCIFPCTVRGSFRPTKPTKKSKARRLRPQVERLLRGTHTYFGVLIYHRMRMTAPENLMISLVVIIVSVTVSMFALGHEDMSVPRFIMSIIITAICAEIAAFIMDGLFRFSKR